MKICTSLSYVQGIPHRHKERTSRGSRMQKMFNGLNILTYTAHDDIPGDTVGFYFLKRVSASKKHLEILDSFMESIVDNTLTVQFL